MSQNRQIAPVVRIEMSDAFLGLSDAYPAGSRIPSHQHDSAQLIYATDGVMTVETEAGTWVVPPERAVWVPEFISHSIRMTGEVQMRTLYVAPAASPVESSGCYVVQVSRLLRACIERFFELPKHWSTNGPAARLVSVLFDEIRAAPTAPLHLPTPRDDRALRVAEAFREEPSVRRSIGEWAKFAGASERTLERMFARDVGMTFGRWQQQARLLRALEILASGHSVTQAALEVGFETPSAFIAMFRRAMGATPARYFREVATDSSSNSKLEDK